MRAFPLISALSVALAAAGCARHQAAYYVIDPATGRAVPVVAQQYAHPAAPYQAAYQAPATYPPQTYQAPAPAAPAPATTQALYSASPANAQQAYDQQVYADANRQQAAASTAAPPASEHARGLFTSGRGLFGGRRTTTLSYAPQPAPQAAVGGPYVPAASSYAYAPATANAPYTLDSGDKLRIVVFGQDGISNTYIVDAGGNINLPLVGSVPARGVTTQQLAQLIAERLKQGYVREPHVSVEVETYRPFFILGEVTTPGQYPYVANMTAETAVAIAGGFSPRADKSRIELTRNTGAQHIHGDVPLNYPLRPGDTVVVKERWF